MGFEELNHLNDPTSFLTLPTSIHVTSESSPVRRNVNSSLAQDIILDRRKRRRHRRRRERRVLRRVLVPDEPGVAQVRGQLRSDAGQVSEEECDTGLKTPSQLWTVKRCQLVQ